MVSKNNIAKRHTLRKTPRCIAALSAILICLSCLVLYTSCSISYKFNGSSIDYTKIQSIQIGNFPIRSTYVWAPMQAIFQNKLTDLYANQTRLKQVKRNGDLVLEGEIVGFDQFNKGVSNSGYSNQVQLKMTVNVRYTNNKNHAEDFEQKFTATTTYDATQQLVNVQEELVTEMCKDLTDQIFNATVANW
ncbi:MAG: LptE family protein [Bacteroidaceae bacterium]|nr:LptE family protein [Bacteroidaceae bacterium]